MEYWIVLKMNARRGISLKPYLKTILSQFFHTLLKTSQMFYPVTVPLCIHGFLSWKHCYFSHKSSLSAFVRALLELLFWLIIVRRHASAEASQGMLENYFNVPYFLDHQPPTRNRFESLFNPNAAISHHPTEEWSFLCCTEDWWICHSWSLHSASPCTANDTKWLSPGRSHTCWNML